MTGLSLLDRVLGGGRRDIGTVTGHEFGHALGFMMQRQEGRPFSGPGTVGQALILENIVRDLKDPGGPKRIAH
jgi:hypothetical protein